MIKKTTTTIITGDGVNLERLKSDLLRHEGLWLLPYKDSVGKTTIGVGRNLEDVGINEEEASFLLQNDIVRASDQLLSYLPWVIEMPEAVQEVLINMCFNLGVSRLLHFKKALAAMKARDWGLAKVEMLDSRWATQVGKRAIELADRVASCL